MHLLIYFTLISSLLLNGVSKLVYFPPGGPDANVFLNQNGLPIVIEDIDNRDKYTARNKLVSENNDENVLEWAYYNVKLEVRCLSIPTPFWIRQPTDWNTTKCKIH